MRAAIVLTAARPELQSTHRHGQSANVELIKLGDNPVRLINSSMHYGWKGTLIFVFIWALFVYMDERGPYMGLDEVVKIFWPLVVWMGARLIFLPAKNQSDEPPRL